MAGPSGTLFDQDDRSPRPSEDEDTGDLSAPSKQFLQPRTNVGSDHISSSQASGSRSPLPSSRTSPHSFNSPEVIAESSNGDTRLASQKDTTDWYVEGSGVRRVGYDDLSAIDWIFEYAKERQRVKRLLAGAHGATRTLKQLADDSHVWVVLILTGISVGFVAAGISIVSDWLGDIKQGYCKTGADGGKFYLSRQFCCWGHDNSTQCADWTPWREALGISNAGLGYTIEFVLFVCFAVVFATAAALLVKEYSPYAKSSGIPEIKTVLGGFVMRRFMGGWTLATKSLGLCLSVSSGLWVGKEGPMVHVACCCANMIMKPFASLSHNEARKREVLSAASAAGISVAFGAPIGGVLFSLEQLSYYFPDKTMWQSFVCAMIAAVTLQALNPFHTGQIVLFQVTHSSDWHSFEMLPFVILGLMGGIYGGLFIHLNMLVTRFRRSEHNPLQGQPLLEVLFISALSAAINFPNIFMRAQITEVLSTLFADCATTGNTDIFGLCQATAAGSISMTSLLVTAAGLGSLLAAITLGLPIPAGIILPSLAVGALSGRAVGVAMEMLHRRFSDSLVFAACEPDVPCIIPGTYAIVGAAASLAGVTRLTVSIIVIMFELTGALSYVLPIMIAVMLAKWIGDAISQRGIYEAWIHLSEYPYLDNKDNTQIPHVPVSNVMTEVADMTCVDASKTYTIQELRSLLKRAKFRGYPVISPNLPGKDGADNGPVRPKRLSKNTLLGYISRTELAYALDQAIAARNMPAVRGVDSGEQIKCYFRHSPDIASGQGLDLRPWMDQTPITLSAKSSFQLAVSMFQTLGLRNLLLVEKGALCGILTKKDVWWLLNATEDAKMSQTFIPGSGVLREDPLQDNNAAVDPQDEEAEGLLHADQDAGRGEPG